MNTAHPPFELLSPGGFVNTEQNPPEDGPDLVVYLHGFRSSPSSVKAQKMITVFEQAGWSQRLWVPQLPASPAEAMRMVQAEIQCRLPEGGKLSILGSSLGGFYATVLGEQYPDARVVLMNPAVKPYEDLVDQIGRKKVYFSEEEIEFVPEYLNDLKAMERLTLQNPSRYFLVAATGDEVLDFNQMVARYPGTHQCRIQGSDHALTEFDDWLPLIQLFLGVK
ncbi:MAG: YqiA/YcfP family alpha/beta fold hydrolase [Limnobacter sp.]|nr:YqiA/YcfP family alpha/beta fold hydrolase [Limnobacter sp.]